jgi:hypothetical protein
MIKEFLVASISFVLLFVVSEAIAFGVLVDVTVSSVLAVS